MERSKDSLTLQLSDLAATDRLAAALASAVQEQAIIALNGPLGVGKTRLVQGAAKALGIKEVVNSPTFTMMNEYHSGRLPLYHFDLYRLSEANALSLVQMLGTELEELLAGPSVIMIEWAELLNKPEFSSPNFSANFLVPLDHLVAALTYCDSVNESRQFGQTAKYKEEERRNIVFQPSGARSRELLDKLSNAIGDMVVTP